MTVATFVAAGGSRVRYGQGPTTRAQRWRVEVVLNIPFAIPVNAILKSKRIRKQSKANR